MSLFFTSDLHLNHVGILTKGFRPFSNVDEMNETIIDRWNGLVNKRDTVYVLGDIVMGQRSQSLELVKRLNGRIILVPGNHDYAHPCTSLKKYVEFLPIYLEYMYVTEPIVNTRYRDLPLLLSHPPYETDTDKLRGYLPQYTYSNLFYKGAYPIPLLHGHTHSAQPLATSAPISIDVGVDGHDYTPWHMEELYSVISRLNELHYEQQ